MRPMTNVTTAACRVRESNERRSSPPYRTHPIQRYCRNRIASRVGKWVGIGMYLSHCWSDRAKNATRRLRVKLACHRAHTAKLKGAGSSAGTASKERASAVAFMNSRETRKEAVWEDILDRNCADVFAGFTCMNAKEATAKAVTTAENNPV